MMWWALFILLLGVAWLTGNLAEKRGRNQGTWFLLGFLFGLSALLVLFLLPDLNRGKKREEPIQEKKKEIEQESPLSKFKWYYLDSSRVRQGPLTFQEFATLWREKRVLRTSLVWYEELEEWKKLQELPAVLSEMSQ